MNDMTNKELADAIASLLAGNAEQVAQLIYLQLQEV